MPRVGRMQRFMCVLTILALTTLSYSSISIAWPRVFSICTKLLSLVQRVDDVLVEAIVQLLWNADKHIINNGHDILKTLIDISVQSQTLFGTNTMNKSFLDLLCRLTIYEGTACYLLSGR